MRRPASLQPTPGGPNPKFSSASHVDSSPQQSNITDSEKSFGFQLLICHAGAVATTRAVSSAAALMKISDRVRAMRKELLLTQQQLADLAGVSDATVRQIERGTGKSTLKSVLSVMEVLGLELEVTG
ncbi:helix-turn-helix domain-containing protein [Micrococcus luteus]|uniref:helix-turn-helix domain-containing protein n=1 Tax=Micrococcus luteus TaxID=1270 RepID=UPI0035AB86AA